MCATELFHAEQEASESIEGDAEAEVGAIAIERNGPWRRRLNGECDTSGEACLMHRTEYCASEHAATERARANEAGRPTLARKRAHVGWHARVLWEAAVIESGWRGAMWSARGGVGHRVVAAHVGAVGEPHLVAALRMRGRDAGVGSVNQQFDESEALACGRHGALFNTEAQGAEAALGTRGKVE